MKRNDSLMEIIMRPIGVIHSPFTEKDQTPIQVVRSQAIGQVEVYPEFADGLKDIEYLSHIHLLYVFHRSSGYNLHVKPFGCISFQLKPSRTLSVPPEPDWNVHRAVIITYRQHTHHRRRGCARRHTPARHQTLHTRLRHPHRGCAHRLV